MLPINEIEYISCFKNIFLACSGGMDSMVLSTILLKHGIRFSIAHCNFQLRGADSKSDHKFVREYCKMHTIPFYDHVANTRESMKLNKTSLEVEARNIRYDFFESLTEKHKIDLFLTAHHLDDNIETITMRLIKGSGLKGLSGIPKQRGIYYRPLINTRKTEIINYAETENIEYQIDSSNLDTNITRNFIRKEITPKFSDVNTNYHNAFQKYFDIVNQSDSLLNDSFSDLKKEFYASRTINLEPYSSKPYLKLILYYILEVYSPNHAQITVLESLFGTDESKMIELETVTIGVKNHKMFVIEENNSETNIINNIDELKKHFSISTLNASSNHIFQTNHLYFDANKLEFPLLYREWKNGDKIQLMGLNGLSKKISKILKDEKLNQNQKRKTRILEDKNSNIIAIPFICISELVMITDNTEEVLQISI